MPPNSEIEKLERRWRDNPKGTVFAPYAEVLRKHGDHELAREVLRQGLELHPDHIPGNIVLGRCCLDLREDGPAEAAFTHVLELDVENVIALKALADITERQGRLLEASHWLSRLISVDPSNDEAKDQFGRVEGAREAAAAIITGQLTTQAGQASPPDGEELEITETGGGDITDPALSRIDEDTDAAVDAAVAAFDLPLPPTREVPSLRGRMGRPVSPAEAETVPVMPVIRRESLAEPVEEPIPELEPMELDLPRMSAEISAEPLDGMELDEAFAPPTAETAPAREPELLQAAELLGVGIEERSDIELSPAGGSEFQSPDHSADLLNLSAGGSEFQSPDAAEELAVESRGSSEFQTPDAAQELAVGSRGSSEFQTPSSGSEDLRSRMPPSPEQEPEELQEPEPATGWEPAVYTSGYAAISMSPTEELVTAPPPWRDEPPAPPVSPPAPFEEPEPSMTAGLPMMDLSQPTGVTETDSGSVDEADTTVEPPAPAAPAPLKLIFPDEAAEAEPPRRRISEEALEAEAGADTALDAAEPVPEPLAEVGEPELVVTESMAELYARQGHFAEAVNVYQVLLAQRPRDARLAERLAEVEAAQQAGRRRLSFVAVDTGGESVESFFRSLAEARPGSPGAGAMSSSMMGQGEVSDAGGGAPTRPANDPLSLSAIFGEEPQAPRGAPPAAAEPPSRPSQDAFSFDQFFAGTPGPGGGPAAPPRTSGPRDEDLDQFQHWLKSLKR